ncbi:MAG: glycosyltransferase family 2 protein, partial [Firmicutes bacterium]|nr:glycosyltransferase family 2 protein [Bacillota bacterium]
MKLLTFVIPAYNSEQFLDKCITSMLAAEILEQLEIIVVNDGSTDGTVQIAENYCTNYPDVVRLISQENKGHGGALNTGCAAAQGKYLKVIDADDWVETQNLSIFFRYLGHCDSEVVLTHHHTIDISNGEIKNWRNYPDEFGKRYSFTDVMSSWKSFDRSLTFHGITYRTDFYQKYAKPLPEHVFYEDHEYATFPCCMAESITCFDLFIYDYRIGDVNQ